MSDTFSEDHLFAAANRGSVRTLDLLMKSAGMDVSTEIPDPVDKSICHFNYTVWFPGINFEK
jgi:hypothetical protein